jgi:Uma2 family endonuclease
MALPTTPTTPPLEDVVYPESDGQPMGETGFHVRAMLTLLQVLMDWLTGRDDVYMTADMFLYYERGNPRAVKAPDVMVVFGVDNHERRTFKTWEENAVPTVIFEVSSDETYQEDLTTKRDLYERLGVAEYFLFDPLGDCLDPRLQGFRLEGGRYVTLTPEADGSLISEQLGVRLVAEGFLLRLIDARTGEPVLTSHENFQLLRRETERLQAEIAQKEHERQAKERERRAKERERRAKERERQRAEALEAEVARLRALLDQQGHGD